MSVPEDKKDHEGDDGGLVASWVRQYTLVFEFLASLALFGYLGYVLDRRYGWQSWATLAGLLVGMTVGLYLMIRESHRQDR